MKRRDFVKGLVSIQLAAMAAEIGCTKKPESEAVVREQKRAQATTKQLNVVVHGMFAIIVDRKGQKTVSLQAPYVTPHVYTAATFTKDPANPQNLLPGWSYTLTTSKSDSVTFNRGTDPNLSLSIGEPDRLAIDVSTKKSGAKAPYWTIELPLPDDICGLRPALANYFSPCITGYCSSDRSDNQTYKNNEMFFEQHCPLIYVLTYRQIPMSEKVVFSGNGQSIDCDTDAGRLHFFAEPNTDPGGSGMGPHVDDAISQLNQLFKPPLTLLFWKDRSSGDAFEVGRDPSVNCQGNDSVVLCEERTLYELGKSCADFLKTETIDEQFKEFIALETEFQTAADQTNPNLAPKRAHHFQPGTKIYEKLRSALPSNGKPPSNCMSLLCIKS